MSEKKVYQFSSIWLVSVIISPSPNSSSPSFSGSKSYSAFAHGVDPLAEFAKTRKIIRLSGVAITQGSNG